MIESTKKGKIRACVATRLNYEADVYILLRYGNICNYGMSYARRENIILFIVVFKKTTRT